MEDRSVFFDSHPEPMWIYDRGTLSLLDVNKAALNAYGYTRDEFLRLSRSDLLATLPNEAERAYHLPGQDDWTRTTRTFHRTKAGRLFAVDVRTSAITQDGKSAILVSARPVADNVDDIANFDHNIMQKLAEHDVNLRTAKRLLGIGFWKWHVESGRLLWSDNLYSLHGFAIENFTNDYQDYLTFVHPDDRQKMIEQFSAFTKSGGSFYSFEHRIIRPNGSIVHLAGVGEKVVFDGETWLAGVVHDITARRETEARLIQATHLLDMAERSARLGGWKFDLATRTLEWTSQIAAIHGLPDGTILSLNDAIEGYTPESQKIIHDALQVCEEHGTPFDVLLNLVTPAGKTIWVKALGEAERDAQGNICALQGALQDLTDLVLAQQQAEKLSQRLIDTFESMSDGFYALDTQARFTFFNSAAEVDSGITRSELIGRKVWDVFPDVIGTNYQVQYNRVVTTRHPTRFTHYFPPMEKWFEIAMHPAPDGITAHFRDVTDQRARDEQLALLENAVSRQNDLLIITEAEPIDGPDGPRVVYVNDALTRLTGYTPDEIIGKTPRILQGPKTQRDRLDNIRLAMESWQPVREEIINYTKSGQEIWLELEIVPIADETGHYTHWVAIERDITDRKQAEEALNASNTRFEMVARAVNDLVWDWDLEANTIWWSDAVESRFGHDRSRIDPSPDFWISHIHPAEKNRVVSSIFDVLNGTADTWTEEYQFRCGDGTYLTVVDRGYVIRSANGKAMRMIGTMMDVTKVRLLDSQLRQSQKMEAIGQLTGGVAHDFNNLLTVILGNAEVLTEELKDQQQMRMLAEMTATAAERGAELTSRLLAFARKQPLEPRLVDMNRLIADMDGMLRRTLSEDIEIEFLRAGGLWLAEVDPGQLEAALLNLAINARDAMPDGGKLTIETGNAYLDDSYADTHLEVASGQYVMLTVSDSGVGMSRQTLERAFEPFFTTKPMGKGSGLGLSMVYGFAKQSAGHVKIYSEQGVGTTIKMYFPRGEAQGHVTSGGSLDTDVEGGHEHVLVVEDDPLVRDHVISLLRSLGYRVTGAASGPVAIEIIHQLPDIDLLFTDVVMPGGMNGPQLAKATKELRPDIKILFTSGYTENAIVHHGRLDRGVELLSKPYRRQELATKVRKVLDT